MTAISIHQLVHENTLKGYNIDYEGRPRNKRSKLSQNDLIVMEIQIGQI